MKGYIKKLLRESLIREGYEENKQKLISLIKTGDEDSIELAYAIGEGQGINVNRLVKSEYGELLNIAKLNLVKAGTIIKDKLITLINLKKLNLAYDKLTSLPESIGKLTNLEQLDLNKNNLTSLPKSIENLTNLKKLGLSNNKLTTLPDWIGKLTNLKTLWLYDNPISDEEKKRIRKLLPNTNVII